jgi:hypothetical protein
MKTLLCLALLAIAAPVFAQDHAEIDKSQIIGNRELPKVLYIVPWKKPVPGDLSGKPLESVLDEALAPVDKDVFRREVKYETPAETAASGKNQDQAVKTESANSANSSATSTGNKK